MQSSISAWIFETDGRKFYDKSMNENIPIRQISLADQVLDILVERIINRVYPPGSKLPPEDQLREEFDVSRSTIRTAISRLEDRKLLYRQQGVGTYISKHPNISNPLNEFIEFPQLIKDNGFKPGYLELSSEMIIPDEEILTNLQLEPGTLVLKIRKIFTANGDPIIYVINYIPVWIYENILSPEQAVQSGTTKKFMEFFEKTCNNRVSHFISIVKAEILGNIDAEEIFINSGPDTPVLVIKETGYNDMDKPIVSSCEYHPGDWMTFRMMRRRGVSQV
jgi:GntR family transcriptional regulator